MTSAADVLRACRPDLEIAALEELGTGDFCRAYLLNAHLVVRTPKHAEAAHALAREACVLPGIAPRLSVTVPAPQYVTCSTGESLSLHEYVPGDPLTRELWQGLPDSDRTHVAQEVGRFLDELHGVDTAVAADCDPVVANHAADVERLRHRLQEPLLPDFLRRDLDRCFSRYLTGAIDSTFTPALLHADLSPGHVLVNPEHTALTGIIDWGDVRIGDPARDFIFLFEDWGNDFLHTALDAYRRETPGLLLPRVYLHYLADQLDWTLAAAAAGRHEDVEHGVALLSAGVLELARPAQ